MSSTVPTGARSVPVHEHDATVPIIAEVGSVRLLWHARELRGDRSLREAAVLVGMNRDELGRIERGETKQIQFATLAKLVAAYQCTLNDLFEIEVADEPGSTPLYTGALAALAAGTVSGGSPRRRAVRRSTGADVLDENDEASFAGSTTPSSHRRRRSAVGTLNR